MSDAGDKPGLGRVTKSCSAHRPAVRVLQYSLLSKAGELLPDWRVAGCKKRRIDGSRPVAVAYSSVYQAAYFGNLQSCGSVWVCPVCGAKVAERRRQELDEAVSRWWADGHAVMLLTFTLQHTAGETWGAVLDALTKAHHRFWSDRAGQRLQQDYNLVGKVRGLEPTYGKNGPHPHFHVLVFLARELSDAELESFEAAAVRQWTHVLSRFGRYASDRHGLVVQRGHKKIADYVAKFGNQWSIAHELTTGRKKKGEGDTPLGLLAKSLAGDDKAGRLWVEYAVAFKGKRQLVWSDGLRELLGLGQEKSDEELAIEPQVATDHDLVWLWPRAWWLVRANDIRAELLNAGDGGDQQQLRAFLEAFGIEAEYPAIGPPGGESEVDGDGLEVSIQVESTVRP